MARPTYLSLSWTGLSYSITLPPFAQFSTLTVENMCVIDPTGTSTVPMLYLVSSTNATQHPTFYGGNRGDDILGHVSFNYNGVFTQYTKNKTMVLAGNAQNTMNNFRMRLVDSAGNPPAISATSVVGLLLVLD